MWLVYKINNNVFIYLVWYFILIQYWIEQINCLNNRVLMASRSSSRALVIPYDIAENLGVENQVNEPYRFSYKVQDNSDNMQFRNEEKMSDGQVKGSYGYKDANGIYRMVNYYSDATGFHAKVFSNEPGILPRRDHVNSINRELFAKQTPLAYNPANVELVYNINQPDFSRLNTMASEYNGDWRSSNYNNNDYSSQLFRENYAFTGGDQYAGAASHVVESHRLNSLNNNLYENEKDKKLSLLVVPKTTNNKIINNPIKNRQDNSVISNFKTSENPTVLNTLPQQQSVNQQLKTSLIHQIVEKANQNNQAIQPVQTFVQHRSSIVNELNHHQQQSLPIIRQQPTPQTSQQQQPKVKKERRRITAVRKVAKKAQRDHTYFNTNSKIEITQRKNDNNQSQNDNLSLKEFSAKFPEKWHQIFSSDKTFNQNDIYDENRKSQYAQLEAVAVRPDINLLATVDQSFIKPITKKEQSIQKQSLTKKIDRVGVLPRKSVQYVPPLNSETLLTSATIQSNSADQTTSPRLIPRMMNPLPPTTTLKPLIKNNENKNNKVQSSTTLKIQSSTPTSINSSLNTVNLITNPSSTTTTAISTMKTTIIENTTTMSPTKQSQSTTTLKMNEKEEIKNNLNEKIKLPDLNLKTTTNPQNTTELPLITSTSVSIVTSTSIDERKKDLKATISPIIKL